MRPRKFGDGRLAELVLDEARNQILPSALRWFGEGWAITSTLFARRFWGTR